MMLDRLTRLNDFCRKEVNSEWPIQHMRVFLEIVANHPEGINQTELAERLDMSQPVISRACKALGQIGKVIDGEKVLVGPGLVYTTPDPFEARRMRVYLTPRGVEIADSMERILNGENL